MLWGIQCGAVAAPIECAGWKKQSNYTPVISALKGRRIQFSVRAACLGGVGDEIFLRIWFQIYGYTLPSKFYCSIDYVFGVIHVDGQIRQSSSTVFTFVEISTDYSVVRTIGKIIPKIVST